MKQPAEAAAAAAGEGAEDAGCAEEASEEEDEAAAAPGRLRGGRGEDRSACALDAFGHASVRAAYGELGPGGFYEACGSDYRNPHYEELFEALQLGLSAWAGEGLLPAPRRALDLACGSGEASAALLAWAQGRAQSLQVDAADPFTREAYSRRMGREAEAWSFEDVAQGVLEGLETYDLVLCSFCLHLLEKSWLSVTLSALARAAHLLLVATPHKRPVIEPYMGWEQIGEVLHARVRVRLYRSHLAAGG